MASAITQKVYQDFSFHTLDLLDMFVLPVKSLAAQANQEVGAAFFDTDADLMYVSLGASWTPLLAGTTDVATDISLTAPSILLDADVTDLGLIAANDVIVSASGTVEIVGLAGAPNAIALNATGAVGGGIDIDAQSGGVAINTLGPILLGTAVDITLLSTAGSVVVNADESAADAIFLDASTGAAGGVTFATGTGGVRFPQATVTQLTNITTAVTINSAAGVITTVNAGVAANSSAAFTVNNNRVIATSIVTVTVVDYGGTYGANGLPSAQVAAVGAGSFDIVVVNASAANPLSGVLEISFVVV